MTAQRFLLPFSLAAVALVSAGVSYGAPSRATVTRTKIVVTTGKPSEFRFKLSRTSAPHGILVFDIANAGILPHDFELCERPMTSTVPNTCTGKVSKTISPGQETVMTDTVTARGTYLYLCTIPGHAAAGMKGQLKVT
jgi:uncharacterized cupredoxin-like copper-binding protein